MWRHPPFFDNPPQAPFVSVHIGGTHELHVAEGFVNTACPRARLDMVIKYLIQIEAIRDRIAFLT